MMATGTRSLVVVMTALALVALPPATGVAGEETASILGMAWSPQPAPALVVSATGPLAFTESHPEKGVVYVDFAQAVPAEPLAPVAEASVGLRRADLTVVEKGGQHFSRLRLEVDDGVEVAVGALPSGVEIRFRNTLAPAPPRNGESLGDLLAVADDTGVSVLLAGDGPFRGKVFTLDNPPRVVLDLPGVVNHVARRVHTVGSAGVVRVRVAQFATAPQPIVRVVADLDQPMPYHFEATALGGLLRVGGEAPEKVAASVAATEQKLPQAEPATVSPAGEHSAPAAVPAAEEHPAAATVASAAGNGPEPAAAMPGTAPAKPEPAAPVTAVAALDDSPNAAPEQASSAQEPARPAPVKIVDEPLPQPTAEAAGTATTPEEPTASQPVAAAPPSPAVPQPPPVTREPAPTAQQPPPVVAPVETAATPVQPAALDAPPATDPTTAPPSAMAPADSPWTTTSSAMVEQAPPPTRGATGTHEVESQERRFTGEPISLELKDADIKDVLRTFAKITGLNIVVDPDVSGTVTVQLENVPWDQALDIILRINRLDYVVENNVLRVARLSELQREKDSLAKYKTAEEATKPMRTVTKALSYAKAKDVAKLLESQSFILSSRGSVVVDERTNQLIIRDVTDRLDGILNLVDSLDTPNPQVMIEARIVETTKTFSQDLGVTWGFSGIADATHGTTTGLKFPNNYTVGGNVNLGTPGTGGILSLTFGDVLNSFNLDFVLNAAEQKGLVKIVSSPKVQAQNNEKAHIQSGIMIPIQVVANNTVTVIYFNATLSLDVTPQITSEGTVLLDIQLQKREPLAGINLAQATNVPISTRDATTHLMVRDGGTTVIGGIYKFTDQETRGAVPGLGKLPLLGALFRNRNLSTEHDELLIFITPRIVKY
jgi:type IV pilus assembly protein PilQ